MADPLSPLQQLPDSLDLLQDLGERHPNLPGFDSCAITRLEMAENNQNDHLLVQSELPATAQTNITYDYKDMEVQNPAKKT